MFSKRISRSLVSVGRRNRQPLPVSNLRDAARSYATSASTDENYVNIVEVGPRDGLQNEKAVIPPAVKIELINRLAHAGMRVVESGSFVSPKWVPQVCVQRDIWLGALHKDQMAGTAEVISKMERVRGNHYPVLVPNLKGLELLLDVLEQHPATPNAPPPTDEIAVFTAATDAFSKANTNCTVAESLERLEAVTQKALDKGLRVRGYVCCEKC